ncbi:MAG: exonuclease domain-containing protein [Clostridia bacterium]|nr:exonuclease domain-containing protein [Clostridia bacterium]
MEYVILDMEWDSAFFPPEKRFINQIIQIGAVKLDERFNIIDTLDVTVHSSFSKRVSKRFTTLTGITKQMMLSGVSLEEGVKAFNEFVKNEPIIMTWSDSDLYTIVDNEKTILKDLRFDIRKYVDLQKYIQNELRLKGEEIKSQIALSGAAELFSIKTDDFDLHTAKDDSIICALLLKKCYNKERFSAYIKDATDPEFYKKLTFRAYYIKDINSPFIPREYLNFTCLDCKKPLVRKTSFNFHNNSLFATMYCENCDKEYIARISARKTYDDVKLRKKLTLKKTQEEKDEVQPLPEKV